GFDAHRVSGPTRRLPPAPFHSPHAANGYGLGPDLSYRCSRARKPSVSVCMKLTSASSSASERPSRPMRFVFMLSVDSGAGQHAVPSPGSFGWQPGRTSRAVYKCTIDFTLLNWPLCAYAFTTVGSGRLSTSRSVGTRKRP